MWRATIRATALGAASWLNACEAEQPRGPLVGKVETVALDPKATAAAATVAFGAGEIRLQPADAVLCQLAWQCNVPEWQPTLEQQRLGSKMELTLQQETGDDKRSVDVNEWDLAFATTVPWSLELRLGVADANLNFGAIPLSDLQVECGVGDALLDLRATPQPFVGAITAGVSNLEILLPAHLGVKLQTEFGLTSVTREGLSKRDDAWVNEAYAPTQPALELRIKAGVSRVVLRVADS